MFLSFRDLSVFSTMDAMGSPVEIIDILFEGGTVTSGGCKKN